MNLMFNNSQWFSEIGPYPGSTITATGSHDGTVSGYCHSQHPIAMPIASVQLRTGEEVPHADCAIKGEAGGLRSVWKHGQPKHLPLVPNQNLDVCR